MPMYFRLRYAFKDKTDRKQVIKRLSRLRARLDEEVPDKDADENLLLATWNIRDLGKGNRRGFGKRLAETHFYIAEVISRFDIVAVQEVNALEEWDKVMDILGPDWDYLCSDVTDSALGGNGERLTFVFDRRKVRFRNTVGEIVLPARMLISKVTVDHDGGKLYAGKQFRRSPYLACFQSGWFKFDLCTVHIYYGKSSGEKLQERIEEIDRIAKYLSKRAKKVLKEQDRTTIALGDFNIVHPDHGTMAALLKYGLVVPEALRSPTNIDRSKYYDQIAFTTRPEVVARLEVDTDDPKQRNAGVVELFKSVFRNADFKDYAAAAKASPNGKNLSDAELRKYYRTWRTYQFSDHSPMWCRLRTDGADDYLERLAKEP